MSSNRRIVLLLFFFTLLSFFIIIYSVIQNSKLRLDPSTSFKVLWLSFAIMFSMLIPWGNCISPRDEEYEDMEREPINA